MKIIGISGRQRAGKNTAAKAIEKYCHEHGLHFESLAFADALKFAAVRAFGSEWDFFSEDPVIKKRNRKALQALAEGRTLDPMIWVDKVWALLDELEKVSPDCVAVITDVRYPNEVDAILERGGYIIRLTRHPHKDSHESETALDEWEGVESAAVPLGKNAQLRFIYNSDMTIEETNAAVTEVIEDILGV